MDKLTYEQRVQQMSEKIKKAASEEIDNYACPISGDEAEFHAKIVVAAQADSIKEALQYVSHTPEIIINAFLGQNGYRVNGYEPAPEVKEVDPVISHYAKEAEKRSIPRNEKTILQLIKEGSLCGCGGAYRIMNCVSFCTRCGKERI